MNLCCCSALETDPDPSGSAAQRGLVLPLGPRRKFGATPGNRAPHGPQIDVFTLEPHVPVRAVALIQILGRCARERETPGVQFARWRLRCAGGRFTQEIRGRCKPTGRLPRNTAVARRPVRGPLLVPWSGWRRGVAAVPLPVRAPVRRPCDERAAERVSSASRGQYEMEKAVTKSSQRAPSASQPASGVGRFPTISGTSTRDSAFRRSHQASASPESTDAHHLNE